MGYSASVEQLRDFYINADRQYPNVKLNVDAHQRQLQDNIGNADNIARQRNQSAFTLNSLQQELASKRDYRQRLLAKDDIDSETQSAIDQLTNEIYILQSEKHRIEIVIETSQEEEREYRAKASESQKNLENICSQCGNVANALDHYSSVLVMEAQKVQTQSNAFEAMTSKRFGQSAGYASDQRSQTSAQILTIATQTKQLANKYRELAKISSTDTIPSLGARGPTRTAMQALPLTNPNFHSSSAYQDNCQRCVWAFEMLRRGYSVEAESSDSSSDYTGSFQDIRNFWFSAKNAKPEQYMRLDQMYQSVDDQYAMVEQKMREWGEGSRAILGNVWKHGSGHIWNVEYSGGKVHYYDGQIGQEVDIERRNSKSKQLDIFARVDDLDVPEYIMKAVRVKEERRSN